VKAERQTAAAGVMGPYRGLLHDRHVEAIVDGAQKLEGTMRRAGEGTLREWAKLQPLSDIDPVAARYDQRIEVRRSELVEQLYDRTLMAQQLEETGWQPEVAKELRREESAVREQLIELYAEAQAAPGGGEYLKTWMTKEKFQTTVMWAAARGELAERARVRDQALSAATQAKAALSPAQDAQQAMQQQREQEAPGIEA
jgi:hypothetical protein